MIDPSRLLREIGSFEHAEALLAEIEREDATLRQIASHAKHLGWTEHHKRVAQVLFLAMSNKELFDRLLNKTLREPVQLTLPVAPSGQSPIGYFYGWVNTAVTGKDSPETVDVSG